MMCAQLRITACTPAKSKQGEKRTIAKPHCMKNTCTQYLITKHQYEVSAGLRQHKTLPDSVKC